MNQHATTPIKIMLVDDSTLMRGVLSKMLQEQDDMKIVAARSDGQAAISAARQHQPDIVLLDVEMPVMDGLTALPQILSASPKSQIIMFSNLTAKGADTSLKALALGAVECLAKPTTADDIRGKSEFSANLFQIIRGLHTPLPRATIAPQQIKTERAQHFSIERKPEIIAIGSSTGGPHALFEVISHLSGLHVPIVVTQHMPATFTTILAQHIAEKTGMPAHEGSHGMSVQNGHVYVAPGGYHMVFARKDARLVIQLDDRPPVNYCKPSVDVMFSSLANLYEGRVLGLVLTGMGNDGLEGAKQLVAKSNAIIAQNQESCVVWGMPRAVEEAGLCKAVLPLSDIGPRLKTLFKVGT